MTNGLSWCWDLFCLRLRKANPVEFPWCRYLWDNLWLLCPRWYVRFRKFLLIYFVGRILVERMGSALPPAWSWKRKRKGLLNFCCFGENRSVLYICVYVCGLPSPTPRTIWWDVLMCFCVRFSFTNREFFERMIWSRGFSASVRNCVWRLHTELWEIT